MGYVIDSDQHLFESRDLWRRYADPSRRDDALAIVDDELGASRVQSVYDGLPAVGRKATTGEN